MKIALALIHILASSALAAPPVPEGVARIAAKADVAFHASIDDQGKLKLRDVWVGDAKEAEKHIQYYNSSNDGKIVLKMLVDIGTTGMVYMRYFEPTSDSRREGVRNVGRSIEMWEKKGVVTTGQGFKVADLKKLMMKK